MLRPGVGTREVPRKRTHTDSAAVFRDIMNESICEYIHEDHIFPGKVARELREGAKGESLTFS